MLKDVKPPVDFPPDYFFLYVLLIALVVIALFLLVRFLMKGKKKKAREEIVPPKPPWEIACEDLKKLAEENLPSQGKIKEYYIRLSDIVRHYIEARFNVRAPEMTTEEFLFSLKRSACLTASQKDAVKEFLNCCDMVKFAKHAASNTEMEQSFVSAERLVRETTP